VDRDLGTIGPCDFGGRLHTAMTAHPKTDPDTGELHFYGYSPVPPYLTYHRLSAVGELVVSRRVRVPKPTLMHDAAITAHHVVWLDLPLTFSLRRMLTGFPFGWEESYGARLGVMRHDDPMATVRWFEIDPCYVFHVGTAHEDETGKIVLDGARYAAADMAAAWSGRRRRAASGAAGAEGPDGVPRLVDPRARLRRRQALRTRSRARAIRGGIGGSGSSVVAPLVRRSARPAAASVVGSSSSP
jgi:carotenoid cleavage dioxygenase